MDKGLEKLLDEHKTTILKYVSSLKKAQDDKGEAIEDVEVVEETEGGEEEEAAEEEEEEEEEGKDQDKESLLRRNQELALILSHSQKTVNEQEVTYIGYFNQK